MFLFLQLLGLVGVRKALEWVFSPLELLWLDELTPEEEKNIPESGLEPEHSFSRDGNEDVSSRPRSRETVVRAVSKAWNLIQPQDLNTVVPFVSVIIQAETIIGKSSLQAVLVYEPMEIKRERHTAL